MTSPADRLKQLQEAIAAEYSIPVTDWRIRQLALYTATQADYEDRLARGEVVDISQLLQLGDAIQTIRTNLKISEPTNITVQTVVRPVGIYRCEKCSHQNRLEPGSFTPMPRRAPTPAAEPGLPPLPVVAKPAAPAGPPKRERPVVADRLSPMSFSSDFDPPRHDDNPFSPFAWPSPNRKIEG
jgi:hypothetical protein